MLRPEILAVPHRRHAAQVGTLLIGLLLMSATPMSQPIVVDEFSLMTTPVLLLKGGTQVSQGTGFFFATTDANGKPMVPFLVTNYHVLTGYAPGEKGPRKGDTIRFFLHRDRSKWA